MKDIILKAENISKQYRLGEVGTGTLKHDLNRWWHKIRGKENPYLKIGDVNDRSKKGNSDYVWALQDINFEVERGEVLGIIGKNGAGKSTLLKILSKVTAPTTGSIKSRGRIASLLEVGTGFNGEMTGRENIFLNGAILGMTKKEITSKLDEIIEFSGCERYIDTPVKRYSSGMTVRLAFAVAAFLEPEILVVDEVLAVGDVEFQKKAIGKMQDISKGEGRTVLFVSHNMAAVKQLCTRGIVLEYGKVVFNNTADKAVNFYLSQNSGKSEQILLERTDRRGSGKIKVKGLHFVDHKKNKVDQVISGEALNICLEIEKYENIDFNKLRVGINFIDQNENICLSFLSDEMNTNFLFLEKSNIFTLEIPNLYLRAEKYSIRVFLSEIDFSEKNFLDVIENVKFLEVLQGYIWKNGKLNRKGNSAILPANFLPYGTD
jgi:lipopolysaccharide transport system ATP-binding protein